MGCKAGESEDVTRGRRARRGRVEDTVRVGARRACAVDAPLPKEAQLFAHARSYPEAYLEAENFSLFLLVSVALPKIWIRSFVTYNVEGVVDIGSRVLPYVREKSPNQHRRVTSGPALGKESEYVYIPAR